MIVSSGVLGGLGLVPAAICWPCLGCFDLLRYYALEIAEEDDEDEIPLEMEDIEAVSKKARQDEDLNTEHLQVGLQC